MTALAFTTEPAGAHIAEPAGARTDEYRYESAGSLLARARSLRAQAKRVNPVLAEAYMRRAAELSLEAWVRAIRTEPVPIDDVVRAAAA